MGFAFQKIKEVVDLINSQEGLKGKIFIAGGIVPWIVSNKDSGRQHGDIDIICKQEDMDLIRLLLKEKNLYHEDMDSLNYEQEGQTIDYGVDTVIRDIPVGFYPYEYKDGTIIQRSFSPNFVGGKRDLKVKRISGLNLDDYLTQVELADGQKLGISTLEVIKATKSMVLRGKDIQDIKQIDRIGIDKERYERVFNAVKNMYSTLDERRKGREPREDIEKSNKENVEISD